MLNQETGLQVKNELKPGEEQTLVNKLRPENMNTSALCGAEKQSSPVCQVCWLGFSSRETKQESFIVH